ncbi:MAG: hypothetical protein KGZ60_06585 [Truepera sp.]|nr:hypothetical protein [Truepera sp.]
MTTLELHFKLLSDATFGRGDGVAGLVDAEVEHDAYGLPFLRGRTLKGLLVEECSNILYSLRGHARYNELESASRRLFGSPGSSLDSAGILRVGGAQLPRDLREAVRAAIDDKNNTLTATDVLESLTAIRRQTAVDASNGTPDEGSLRAMRVILREAHFTAQLDFVDEPSDIDMELALLAACVKGFRRAGTGRNRGRGRLVAWLNDETYTDQNFGVFKALVLEEAA